MVLRVENGVRPEGLCDVFVKVGGEGEVRVEVVDEAAVVRLPQDEQHVVVPDHKLLLEGGRSRSVGEASSQQRKRRPLKPDLGQFELQAGVKPPSLLRGVDWHFCSVHRVWVGNYVF